MRRKQCTGGKQFMRGLGVRLQYHELPATSLLKAVAAASVMLFFLAHSFLLAPVQNRFPSRARESGRQRSRRGPRFQRSRRWPPCRRLCVD
jgi:hypothetical protein